MPGNAALFYSLSVEAALFLVWRTAGRGGGISVPALFLLQLCLFNWWRQNFPAGGGRSIIPSWCGGGCSVLYFWWR
jgi:hypothetical protein